MPDFSKFTQHVPKGWQEVKKGEPYIWYCIKGDADTSEYYIQPRPKFKAGDRVRTVRGHQERVILHVHKDGLVSVLEPISDIVFERRGPDEYEHIPS